MLPTHPVLTASTSVGTLLSLARSGWTQLASQERMTLARLLPSAILGRL